MPRKKAPAPDLGPSVKVVVQTRICESGFGILQPGAEISLPLERAKQLGKRVKITSQPAAPPKEPIVKKGPVPPAASPKKGFDRMAGVTPAKDE